MASSLDRLQAPALLIMRLALGIIMIAHGFQKIAHPGQTAAMMESFGMPGWTAYLPMAAEFGGGILVVLGLLTRLAALAIVIDLAAAMVKAHAKAGLLGPNGMELPLALATLGFALICFGAGPFALDRKLWKGGSRKGTPASR